MLKAKHKNMRSSVAFLMCLLFVFQIVNGQRVTPITGLPVKQPAKDSTRKIKVDSQFFNKKIHRPRRSTMIFQTPKPIAPKKSK